ncbi:MAG: hypothetical protein V7K26_31730 [Nostoc sp.]
MVSAAFRRKDLIGDELQPGKTNTTPIFYLLWDKVLESLQADYPHCDR